MVMADPEVGALGAASKEVLTNIGRWSKFKKFIVIAPTSAKTVDLIIKSQTAGIVYSTDARLFSEKLNYIGDIPKKLHTPVEYYAAIVLGDNMEEARKFLTYLSEEQAQAELKNSGFIVQ
jgi:molybdenum ABC transporter molybdate-binding protein